MDRIARSAFRRGGLFHESRGLPGAKIFQMPIVSSRITQNKSIGPNRVKIQEEHTWADGRVAWTNYIGAATDDVSAIMAGRVLKLEASEKAGEQQRFLSQGDLDVPAAVLRLKENTEGEVLPSILDSFADMGIRQKMSVAVYLSGLPAGELPSELKTQVDRMAAKKGDFDLAVSDG